MAPKMGTRFDASAAYIILTRGNHGFSVGYPSVLLWIVLWALVAIAGESLEGTRHGFPVDRKGSMEGLA